MRKGSIMIFGWVGTAEDTYFGTPGVLVTTQTLF